MYGTKSFMKKDSGLIYDVICQMVQNYTTKEWVLRYNIGIMGHDGFNSLYCIYDNKEFNQNYQSVMWNRELKEWVATD